MSTEFLTDRDLYERVIQQQVPSARDFVWIATANVKDLHVAKGRRMVPFLEVLAGLAEKGVSLRLLHAREPGPAFREDFDRYPALLTGLERMLCPRTHLKAIIVDGRFAYTGSANLTGAGIGAKGKTRRNFESGMVTTDPSLVQPIMDQFDAIWMGTHCPACTRKEHCADFPDLGNAE